MTQLPASITSSVLQSIDFIAVLVNAKATCGYDTTAKSFSILQDILATVGPGPDIPILNKLVTDKVVDVALALAGNTDKAVEFCKAVAVLVQ